MIIDGHRHLAGPPEKVIEEMDSLGIDKTVLVGIGVKDLSFVTVQWSFIFKSDLLSWLLGTIKGRMVTNKLIKAKQLLDVPGNDPVLAAIKKYPDRFSGFAFINAGHPDAVTEAKRCLDNGMVGLKFALVQYPAPIAGKTMHDLCDLAKEYQVPVFFHIGTSKVSYTFEKLVRDFPDVTFIIAHAGAQLFSRSIQKAKEFENIYFDLSSYYVTERKVRILIELFGCKRLLMGSDVPVMAKSPEWVMNMIRSLGLNTEDEAAILGGNMSRILEK